MSRRLFYAFWPGDVLRASLEAARGRIFPLSGRPVTVANLHVTAAFLGGVDDRRIEALKALAGPVAPFELSFDRLEHWPKPRVLVAAASQVPEPARRVVDALWQRLDRLGFPRDPRPYQPHVTLARDVRSLRPGLAWTPVAWPVERVHLVESLSTPTGVSYQPLA